MTQETRVYGIHHLFSICRISSTNCVIVQTDGWVLTIPGHTHCMERSLLEMHSYGVQESFLSRDIFCTGVLGVHFEMSMLALVFVKIVILQFQVAQLDRRSKPYINTRHLVAVSSSVRRPVLFRALKTVFERDPPYKYFPLVILFDVLPHSDVGDSSIDDLIPFLFLHDISALVSSSLHHRSLQCFKITWKSSPEI